jgi:homoserine O-acetyltransferase
MDYLQFISPATQFYQLPHPFLLKSGQVLENVQIAYRSWGTLNAARDNAVWVCHAFTGWADLEVWWDSLLGDGRILSLEEDFIGGSLGGMQVLEWALLYPEKVKAIAVIAASGRHSAWCIGLSEAQRRAIYADPNWQGGYYLPHQPPSQGLAVARMIAISTYRSWASFRERFGRQYQSEQEFAIASYLDHHGKKLVERFDANTYITLSRAMDSHDVTRGDNTYESILQTIHQPTLIVAIDSDILYPSIEQEELATLIPQAELVRLDSHHGHDAFLMDGEAINLILLTFRERLKTQKFNEFKCYRLETLE